MKGIILLILGCILFLPALQAEEDGGVKFRSIPWGTHVDSAYKDGNRLQFESVQNNRSSNAFKLSGDDMNIGTVELNELHYIFNENDRFTRVYMEADMKHRPDMSFILRHRFGEPDEVREMIRIKMHEWDVGEVKITLTEYHEQDMFTVTFASRWDQSEAYRINTNIDDF